LRPEAAHLAERMDTGIRATGARQLHIFLGQAAQHGDNLALDRRFIRLNLPAVEIGAVVGNREFEIAHSRQSVVGS